MADQYLPAPTHLVPRKPVGSPAKPSLTTGTDRTADRFQATSPSASHSTTTGPHNAGRPYTQSHLTRTPSPGHSAHPYTGVIDQHPEQSVIARGQIATSIEWQGYHPQAQPHLQSQIQHQHHWPLIENDHKMGSTSPLSPASPYHHGHHDTLTYPYHQPTTTRTLADERAYNAPIPVYHGHASQTTSHHHVNSQTTTNYTYTVPGTASVSPLAFQHPHNLVYSPRDAETPSSTLSPTSSPHPSPSTEDISDTTGSLRPSPSPTRVTPAPHYWRPTWLRRRTLFIFSCIFFCLGLALVALYFYSEARDGLVRTDEKAYYLWTFGPTALIILISAFWSRVELQALKYTPWFSLSKVDTTCSPQTSPETPPTTTTPTQHTPQTLLHLDYITMFSPRTLLRSFLSAHYLVTLPLISSLILKLLIILSTTLFHLQSIPTSVPHPTTLTDRFSVPNLEPLRTGEIDFVDFYRSNQDEMAFLQHLLIDSYNVSYPFGLAPPGIVYERFDINNQDVLLSNPNPNGDTNPLDSITAQYGKTHQVVRGMSFSLSCQSHETATPITLPPSSSVSTSTLTINFTFTGYDKPLTINVPKMMVYPIDLGRGENFAHQTNLSGWVTGECVKTPEYLDYLEAAGATDSIMSLPCRPDQMTYESTPFILASVSFPQTREELTEEDIGTMGAMMCTSHAWESDYEVVDNGTDIRDVQPIAGSPRVEIPFAMETWMLHSVSIPTIEESVWTSPSWGWFYGNQTWKTIPPMLDTAALTFPQGIRSVKEELATALYNWDGERIEDWLTNFWTQFGAFIVNSRFREEDPVKGVGTRERLEERLLVEKRTCLVFVALSFCLGILSSCLAIVFTPRQGLDNLDPGSQLGLAALLAEKQQIESRAHNSTSLVPSNPGLRRRTKRALIEQTSLTFEDPYQHTVKDSNKPTILLSLGFKISSVLALIGVIVALSTTLSISLKNEGLGDAPVADSSLHLLWTTIPTLVLFFIPLFVASCNHATRRLSPMSKLTQQPLAAAKLRDWLDMMGIKVLWHAARSRLWVLCLWEVTAILSSFITIFASMLFTTQTIVGMSPVSLVARSGMSVDSPLADQAVTMGGVFGVLVLGGNGAPSYPVHTYQDLVFPSWNALLPNTPNTPAPVSSNSTIHAVVPAMRLSSTCTTTPPSNYTSIDIITLDEARNMGFSLETLGVGINSGELSDLVIVNFTAITFRKPDSPCQGSDLSLSLDADFVRMIPLELGYDTPPSPLYWDRDKVDELHFGNWLPPEIIENISCDDDPDPTVPLRTEPIITTRWFWGSWSPETKEIRNLAIEECTYAWTDLEVEVSLQGPDLHIDPNQPPRPIESSVRPTKHTDVPIPPIWQESGSSAFPHVTNNETAVAAFSTISLEFRSVLEPVGSLSLSQFGKEEHNNVVLDALNKNIAILAGQVLSATYRVELPAAATAAESSDTETISVPATLQNPSRRRVIQNAIPTYILVGIISWVAIVNAWGIFTAVLRRASPARFVNSWYLVDMEFRGLAPKNYGSIAATMQLWERSNVFRYMPEGAAGVISETDLARSFEGHTFRSGWWRYRDNGEEVYTVMVVQDEGVEYLGTREEVEGVRRKRKASVDGVEGQMDDAEQGRSERIKTWGKRKGIKD